MVNSHIRSTFLFLIKQFMAGNTFGKLFRITTFGESHGPALGVIVDGCPAGLEVTQEEIQAELDRRKPGQDELTTQRKESDEAEILSGVFEGKTLGTPIAILIRNHDAQSKDYEALRDAHRPGHADATYDAKYGRRDHRGGGRASARETAARVAAGAIAKKLLALSGVKIEAKSLRGADEIRAAKEAGDSIGGILELRATGVPTGLGEPVFDKLTAQLAHALMSIPATKGVEFGEGFAAAEKRGSQMQHTGGIAGGISNGEEITVRIAFKPTSSTPEAGVEGRHDPCVCQRAVPVTEAMMALVLADNLLLNKNSKL